MFSVLLICVFLFPPTFKLLKLGQVDIIILGSVIAGTYALEQHRLGSGAFFYALAFTKPQLTIIVFPCLITYWLFIKKDWLYAAKFTFITFFLILILTIPLSISNTMWVTDFFSNLLQNPPWLHPSIYLQLQLRLGSTGIVLWFILYISVFFVSLWLWRKFGSSYAILWSIALTTIVSPYIWSWDFTLLLPLLIDTVTRLKTNIARIILFVFYFASLFFTITSLQSKDGASDAILWWFPIVMMVGIILSMSLSKITIISE